MRCWAHPVARLTPWSQALSPNTFDQRLARLEALLQEEPELSGGSDDEGSQKGGDAGHEAAGTAASGFGRGDAPGGAAAEQDWFAAVLGKNEEDGAAIEAAAATGTGGAAADSGAEGGHPPQPGPRTPGPAASAGVGTDREDRAPPSSSTPDSASDSLDPLSATRRWGPTGPAGGRDRDDVTLTPFSEVDAPGEGGASEAGQGRGAGGGGGGYASAPDSRWDEAARGFGAALAEVGMFDAEERGGVEGAAAPWTQGPQPPFPPPADSGRFSPLHGSGGEAPSTEAVRSAGKGSDEGQGPWDRVNALLTAHAFSPLPVRAVPGESASEREGRLASAVARAVEQVTERLRARDEVRCRRDATPPFRRGRSRAQPPLATAAGARAVLARALPSPRLEQSSARGSGGCSRTQGG